MRLGDPPLSAKNEAAIWREKWLPDIQSWRKKWLSDIQELSNLEMQQATWLNDACKNSHYTYFEFRTCYLYDRSIASHMYGYAAFVDNGAISPAEYAAVKPFHDLLESYEPPNDDDHNDRAILADPKWLKVVEVGRIARENLLRMLKDPGEIAILTIPSPEAWKAASETAD